MQFVTTSQHWFLKTLDICLVPYAWIGFSFDTRDGSWNAAVGLSYASDNLTIAVLFKTSDRCTVRAIEGHGLVSVNFGDSGGNEEEGGGGGSLRGVVRAVRRCGEYAVEQGLFDVEGEVSGNVLFDRWAGVRVNVGNAAFALRANVSDVAQIPAGLDVPESATSSPYAPRGIIEDDNLVVIEVVPCEQHNHHSYLKSPPSARYVNDDKSCQ